MPTPPLSSGPAENKPEAPVELDVLRERAVAATRAGRFDEAAAHYEDILQRLPDDFDILVAIGDLCVTAGGRRDWAAQHYTRALAVRPWEDEVRDKRDGVYRRRVPDWHWRMMNDEDRNRAFADAIARVVTKDSIVLDIGCGSGLLAMMAARAGARHVYTVEVVGAIADVAREIIANHGLSDRITVIAPYFSHEVELGEALPERADVLTAELLGNDTLNESILLVVPDVKHRLLKPGARIIPNRVVVMGQLVESVEAAKLGCVGTVAGFDLSPFNRLWGRRHVDDLLQNYAHRHLSDPFEIFSFDFTGPDPECDEDVMIEAVPVADGTCHMLIRWQRIYTDDDHYIDTYQPNPTTDCPSWLQNFEICSAPIAVKAGRPVRVRARHDATTVSVDVLAD